MHNLYSEENSKIISRIIEIELSMVDAISKGHKCADNDIFKENREELKILRKKIGLIK